MAIFSIHSSSDHFPVWSRPMEQQNITQSSIGAVGIWSQRDKDAKLLEQRVHKNMPWNARYKWKHPMVIDYSASGLPARSSDKQQPHNNEDRQSQVEIPFEWILTAAKLQHARVQCTFAFWNRRPCYYQNRHHQQQWRRLPFMQLENWIRFCWYQRRARWIQLLWERVTFC